MFLSIDIVILYAMNLAFIRYFLAVAETGNFTAAAERCHVTQPTLSAGIARLEEEIGSRLFDRGRRTALSAAGQRLLPHARAMVEAWRLARAEQRSSRRTRLVRVALASTLPVASAMRWLAAAQGQVAFDLEISEGTAEAVVERWRRGRCDIALFPARDGRDRGQRGVPVARTLHAGRRDRAIASRRATAGRSRISPTRRSSCAPLARRTTRRTRLVAAEGVRPRAVLRSADEERCAAAVLAGLGVSLMPRSLLRPGMAAAEIREVALERRVMLAWREDRTASLWPRCATPRRLIPGPVARWRRAKCGLEFAR